MNISAEVPMPAGVRKTSKDQTPEDQARIEVAKSGHPDRRFGIVPKLGKDGCGY